MIRVLKNADFSGCDLGVVSIPMDDTPEALAVVSKFDNISAANKAKVKALINGLVDEGIYGSLNYLMLPYVAGNVNEAVQNVLNATQSTINLGSTNPSVVSGHGLTFANKGRVSIYGNCRGVLSGTDFSFGGCMEYNTTFAPSGGGSMGFLYTQASGSTTSRIYSQYNPSNGNRSLTLMASGVSNERPNIQNSASNTAIQVASISKTLEKIFCVDGFGSAIDERSINTSSFVNSSGLSISGANDTDYHHYMSGYYRLIFAGSSLSKEKVAVLRDLIAEFCDHEME